MHPHFFVWSFIYVMAFEWLPGLKTIPATPRVLGAVQASKRRPVHKQASRERPQAASPIGQVTILPLKLSLQLPKLHRPLDRGNPFPFFTHSSALAI